MNDKRKPLPRAAKTELNATVRLDLLKRKTTNRKWLSILLAERFVRMNPVKRNGGWL